MSRGNTTHGMKGTKTYAAWQGMLDRCRNKNSNSYRFYGAIGIRVCKRWYKFANFWKDMGTAPEGLTLDRKDSLKNYNRTNCRWTTWSEQGKNRRNAHKLTYKGKTQSISDWARELGFKRSIIGMRILYGWPIKDILNTPSQRAKHRTGV